jgi:hypothetical protein
MTSRDSDATARVEKEWVLDENQSRRVKGRQQSRVTSKLNAKSRECIGSENGSSSSLLVVLRFIQEH